MNRKARYLLLSPFRKRIPAFSKELPMRSSMSIGLPRLAYLFLLNTKYSHILRYILQSKYISEKKGYLTNSKELNICFYNNYSV